MPRNKASGSARPQQAERAPKPVRHKKDRRSKALKGDPKSRRRCTPGQKGGRKKRKLDGESKQRAEEDAAAKKREQEIESACPICQEAYTARTLPIVHAPCGHVACASCSLRWLQKKTMRSCALCRAPVLSVAHCPLLGQLLESRAAGAAAAPYPPLVADSIDEEQQQQRRGTQGGEDSSSSAAAPLPCAEDDADTIAGLKRQLLDLNQGDLNHIPADYRAHIVRQATVRAIRKGDLPMLEACFKSYKSRASTLMLADVAALWKKEPVEPALELLLQHGARLDGHCADRPLHHAVYTGNLPMIKALLKQRADPTKPTLDGSTPLHIAVRRGRQEAVSLLLSCDEIGKADLPGVLGYAEKGLKFHQSQCDWGCGPQDGSACPRCAARKTIQMELLEKQKQLQQVEASSSEGGSLHPEGERRQRHRRGAAAVAAEEEEDDAEEEGPPGLRHIPNDVESDDSSSYAGTSESDVSDLDTEDLSDFSGAEGGEEDELEDDPELDSDIEDSSEISGSVMTPRTHAEDSEGASERHIAHLRASAERCRAREEAGRGRGVGGGRRSQ